MRAAWKHQYMTRLKRITQFNSPVQFNNFSPATSYPFMAFHLTKQFSVFNWQAKFTRLILLRNSGHIKWPSKSRKKCCKISCSCRSRAILFSFYLYNAPPNVELFSYHTFVSYFEVFQMSVISCVFGLQL